MRAGMRAAGVAAGLALAAAGCSSTNYAKVVATSSTTALPTTTVAGAPATTATTAAPTTTTPQAQTGTLGQTFQLGFADLNGQEELDVTVTAVDNSVTPTFGTPDAGDRIAQAHLTIVNKGSQAYSDDANSQSTLTGSDGQTYQTTYEPVAGCTNFNSGEYNLSPGQSTTGCVVFQVPSSVSLDSVTFQPIPLGSNTKATWNVG